MGLLGKRGRKVAYVIFVALETVVTGPIRSVAGGADGLVHGCEVAGELFRGGIVFKRLLVFGLMVDPMAVETAALV